MRSTTACLPVAFATACTGMVDEGGMPPPPPVIDVQITVQDLGSPQAGVRVLFEKPDATVIEIVTDASGLATADLPDGGNLTVIRAYPPAVAPQQPRPDEIYTYVGVKPGDRLRLGHDIATGTPSAINVVVPATLTGTVTVMTPCGNGQGAAPNIPVTVTGCPAMMDLYVSDQNQQYLYTRMPYAASFDLSAQPLINTLAATLTATHVQPNTQVTAELRIVSGNFVLHSSGPQNITAAAANVDLPNLQGVEELLIGTFTGTGYNEMVTRRDTFGITPKTFDAMVGMIPFVSAPTYTPTAITWMEQGPGTADFVMGALTVTKMGAQNPTYIRAVVAPHAGTTLAIAPLTGVDAKYNPSAMDQITGGVGLVAVTGGYDAARAHVFGIPTIVDLAPAGGAVTYSYP